jgi:hypothetical protein
VARAIVTYARGWQSLAITRSLGQQGVDVFCGEEAPFAPAFFSKHCKGSFQYPSATGDPEAFLADWTLTRDNLGWLLGWPMRLGARLFDEGVERGALLGACVHTAARLVHLVFLYAGAALILREGRGPLREGRGPQTDDD